ncbi:hypothetical protein SAMN05421730_101022 [Anaerobium acetethylicum]|uniref:Uncharacterized protein n=1 Tax=Anaerobium acetethylicum TaxID=1619234 RepID=A0A1D3TTS3_9FIRM|nr:hypothetical protein SAMN05421730_101022 [Anaerobium acetethylicum]
MKKFKIVAVILMHIVAISFVSGCSSDTFVDSGYTGQKKAKNFYNI